MEFDSSTATGNVLEGNYVGTDVTGTVALANGNGVYFLGGASTNTVGGTAGDGNVISGNTQYGVAIYGGSGNVLEGNYIGTDKSGTAALGNVQRGVVIESSSNTIGGTVAGAGNVICASSLGGVQITGSGNNGNVLEGNYIGTDKSGTVNLGNANYGVYVDVASNTTIGGTAAGAGNVIANSSGDGVLVDTGTGNSIRGNSIYNSSPLGIQLRSNGNNNQPAPVLTSASANGSQISIAGTLTATASTSYSLDFFSSPSANPSGDGEGKQYLGSATETTNSSGTISFTVTFNVAVPVGQAISATATDPSGNTSAFAQDVTATHPLYVLDLNTGASVPANATLNTFSTWSEDLLAQVSGASVTSYSWNVSQAPDLTSVSGTTTANLQGTWASFTGAPHTDTISVTEAPTVGQTLTQTMTFLVAGTDSPAYSASRPTSSSTWPSVITPDTLTSGQATQSAGPYASIGEADGSVQTSFAMPSYNSGGSPMNSTDGFT